MTVLGFKPSSVQAQIPVLRTATLQQLLKSIALLLMSLLSFLILRWPPPGSLPGQRVTSSLVSPPMGFQEAGRQAAVPALTAFIPPGYTLRASALAVQTEVLKGMRWNWRVVMGQVERTIAQAEA